MVHSLQDSLSEPLLQIRDCAKVLWAELLQTPSSAANRNGQGECAELFCVGITILPDAPDAYKNKGKGLTYTSWGMRTPQGPSAWQVLGRGRL